MKKKIITDTRNETINDLAKYGHNIQVLDISDLKASSVFNPFERMSCSDFKELSKLFNEK